MHWVVLCILVSILASCQCEWPETQRKFDVIFVIENKNKFKDAIRDVATETYMDENEYVHFGAIAFGEFVGPPIGLTGVKSEFLLDVASLNADDFGRSLDLALDKARELMDGDGGRDDADKLVVCMLTGESDSPDSTSLSAHNLRVAYIQVAVFGEALTTEMAEITSDPLRLMKLFHPTTVLHDMGIIFQVTGVCSECRWDNSIHYVPDPANSNAFFQCNSVDNYIRKFCPLGLLWDKELVQCILAKKTLSKDDPCKYHPSLRHYGDVLDRNCSYFWICSAGRTIGYDCCNGTETYNFSPLGLGPHAHVAPHATWPPVYSPPPYPLGNCEQLHELCPEEVCPLVYPTFTPPITPTQEQCYPDIYLTFKPDVQGKGPNNAYIQNRGVRVENPVSEAEDEYAGYFKGNSDLLSERHSHGWYGEYVEIFVRFMLHLGVAQLDRPEILVSNGDYGEIHSIFIGFDRQRDQVIVKFNTTAGYAEGTVDNVQGYWIEVRVIYDGLVHSLTADVTGFPSGDDPVTYPQFSAVLSGNVRQTLPALHVGGYSPTSTREYNDLTGWVDKFWIYTCRPDPYFPGTEP